MKKSASLDDQLFLIGGICFPFLLAGCILFSLWDKSALATLQIPCSVRFLFGIYCPGCGGTRAVRCLLSGHLLQSLWYHPLVGYIAVLYDIYMLSHLGEKLKLPHIKGLPFKLGYLWTSLGIILCNWILKNILLLVFHMEM